ncbi:MAG: Crp/Fnr family transcriptional regulator [Tissierellia bacterium]|nr:Crp/Fnr family transcriptional regulator [Tissierellia bacterium]
MDNILQPLEQSPLFRNIATEDYEKLLSIVGDGIKSYNRGDFIKIFGDPVEVMGIVLSGEILIIKEDVFGNRVILNEIRPGQIFGESFVCGGSFVMKVSVQAKEPSQVAFISFGKMMGSKQKFEAVSTLTQNLIEILARKNIHLVERLEVATKHSIREKVLSYISNLSQNTGSPVVESPLGREDLAGFLGVDRSSLTRELKRMKEDGLIDFEKNKFTIKELY